MQYHCSTQELSLCISNVSFKQMNHFDHLEPMLDDLIPKVREKAIQLALEMLSDGKFDNKEAALKEGIKQAEEWFTELEG